MPCLRTPDDQFTNLPDFDFAAHYVEVADPAETGATLRVHYLDEGPAQGPVVLLMHGEPSWCYLYRHMIRPLVAAGFRCIAPDLVGFGKSDKPIDRATHTYANHVEWMREALFDRLQLRNITYFGQDWGGLIGLRLVGEHPQRYSRVIVSNTGLNTGDRGAGEAFLAWQEYARTTVEFPIGRIVSGGVLTGLTDAEINAYNAPFPSDEYTVAPRTMPSLVPTTPDNPASAANRAAWSVLESWDKPFLIAFSDSDPLTAGGERSFLKVPEKFRQQVVIESAAHFVQEDKGPELAEIIICFINSTN
jgi:haloalkane dehalogenase